MDDLAMDYIEDEMMDMNNNMLPVFKDEDFPDMNYPLDPSMMDGGFGMGGNGVNEFGSGYFSKLRISLTAPNKPKVKDTITIEDIGSDKGGNNKSTEGGRKETESTIEETVKEKTGDKAKEIPGMSQKLLQK